MSTSQVQATLPGTLIGNYDAVTNPTGTLTRPGAFGGAGNLPVNFNATGGANGAATTRPAGAFTLIADTTGLTVSIDGFTADLLVGSTPSFDFAVTAVFQTFRTFNPNSIYPGNFPITIPLGASTLNTLSLAQTGQAVGTLTPAGAGAYDFTLAAPAEATVSVTLLDGSVIGPVTVPAPLVLTGTLTIEGATAIVTLAAQTSASQTIPDPAPGQGVTALPFALPTVLPPGQTANVLVSFTISSITLGFGVDAMIVAAGVAPCPGDTNGDGVVNFIDLNAVLGAFGASLGQPAYSPGADLNADGIVDFLDLNVVLSNYGASCR